MAEGGCLAEDHAEVAIVTTGAAAGHYCNGATTATPAGAEAPSGGDGASTRQGGTAAPGVAR